MDIVSGAGRIGPSDIVIDDDQVQRPHECGR
jgi:hypothetical protein